MTNKTLITVGWMGAFAFALLVNYLFALAGEPRSYWVMHTVLGWV